MWGVETIKWPLWMICVSRPSDFFNPSPRWVSSVSESSSCCSRFMLGATRLCARVAIALLLLLLTAALCSAELSEWLEIFHTTVSQIHVKSFGSEEHAYCSLLSYFKNAPVSFRSLQTHKVVETCEARVLCFRWLPEWTWSLLVKLVRKSRV